MKFEKGNMFEDATGPIFVTTSSFILADGSLMMNRGAASDCAIKHPEIARKFGTLARKYGIMKKNKLGNNFIRFGCLYDPELKVGVFQVKYHFKDDVDLELIRYSASILAGISRCVGTVNMNFPGCGYGDVERRHVIETLDDILDREAVKIWRLDPSEYDSNSNYEVDEDVANRVMDMAENLY